MMSAQGGQPGKPPIAILHYSAPPVVGGVEAVIAAHVKAFQMAGYPVTVVAGRGGDGEGRFQPVEPGGLEGSFPARFIQIPEMDSQHPQILELSRQLEAGILPDGFERMAARLTTALEPLLGEFERVFVHNIFTKHFNLPLTAALVGLLESGRLRGCIAWCHDLSWTSPNSRSKVYPRDPWDLLRSYRPEITYVAISEERRQELAGLFGCPADRIRVIYNGVDPQQILGIRPESWSLAKRLGLVEAGVIVLMPVRITQAKNIEYALQVTAALRGLGLQPVLVITGPPDPHESGSLSYYHSLQDQRERLHLEREARFVYESGPDPSEPYQIGGETVDDLLRLSDLVFMPSHREGFGIPVLEAGLAGIPVACTETPAATEIGGPEVLLFDRQQPAQITARQIQVWLEDNPAARLRRKVRRNFTWEAIFAREIEPLVAGTAGQSTTAG